MPVFLNSAKTYRNIFFSLFSRRALTTLSSKSQQVKVTDVKKNKLPDTARVVIVGGGIIGNSVAYHLGKAGWKDVVLVERDRLTSGTTWHAAGLMVTFGSLSETSTELRKYTRNLYENLEKETGQSTGFKPVGFVELASTEDYLHEQRRVAAFNRTLGVDVHEITPSEIKNLFPLCNVDDVLAGFYVRDDGRVNPVDASMALAKGAKMNGVRYYEDVTVTGISEKNGRVIGVKTSEGDISTEYVVNCAGMWARQFGELAGVSIPNQAAEHYYLVTDPMKDVDVNWPIIEDPSSYTYVRPEVNGGLMIGLFEPEAAAWQVDKIPEDFSFGEIPPDWDRMTPFLEKAMQRVPESLNVGVRSFFCGPESFTPDLNPIVGEAPNLKNYFVAAGMNSIGILTGGGIGRLVANWIVNGQPDMDVTGMNIDRFEDYQSNPEYRADRVVESLGMVYKCHYPNFQHKTARNVKLSPLHNALKEAGAYFKPVSGFESADWYESSGEKAPRIEKYTWNRESWFDNWAQEHNACRSGVALIDMSFMSKFLVQGNDAGDFLNFLSTANVNEENNRIVYTQWLNDSGKVEADLTVSRLQDNLFFVVATDTMRNHVHSWMKNHLANKHVFVTDVTGGYAQINLQGPQSRLLLESLTSANISNAAFPFGTMKEIDIGYARVFCARITYVGELGYELFIPTEQAMHVYDRILEGGTKFDLKHVGLKALNSLRLEKGYRDYGHDIDNTDTIRSVGLSFTCDFEKTGGFLGQKAVLKMKDSGPPKSRLINILVEDPHPMLFHSEVIKRNDVPLGHITSGSYGHTLGGAVGIGMIKSDTEPIKRKFLQEADWTVDIAGENYPLKVSLKPFYDPKNVRIKA